jgi:hypothetical protein
VSRLLSVRQLPSAALGPIRRTIQCAAGPPRAREMAHTIRRATTITGMLLEGVSDKYHASRTKRDRLKAAAADAAHSVWGVVELIAPRNPAAVLLQYWIPAVLAFGLVLLLIGTLTSQNELAPVGAGAIAAGALLHFLSVRLRRFAHHRTAVLLLALAAVVSAVAVYWLFAPDLNGRAWSGSLTGVLLLVGGAGLATAVGFACRGILPRPHVTVLLILAFGLAAWLCQAAEDAVRWLAEQQIHVHLAPLGTVRNAFLTAALIFLAALAGIGVWHGTRRILATRLSAIQEGARKLARAMVAQTKRIAAGLKRRSSKKRKASPKERPRRRLTPEATAVIAQTVRVADCDPDRVIAARSVARALTVTGTMSEWIAETRAPAATRMARWLTRAGRAFRGLTEASVPRSLGGILFAHWHWLLVSFAVTLLIAGFVSGRDALGDLGATAGILALALLAGTTLLRGWFRDRARLYGLALPGFLLGAYLTLAALAEGAYKGFAGTWAPGAGDLIGHPVPATVLRADFAFIAGYVILAPSLGLLLCSETRLWRRRRRLATSALILVTIATAATAGLDLLENARLWVFTRYGSAAGDTAFSLLPNVTPQKIAVGSGAAALLAAIAVTAGLNALRRLFADPGTSKLSRK